MFQRNMTLILVALGINAVIVAIQSNATVAFGSRVDLRKARDLSFTTIKHHAGACIHNDRCDRSAAIGKIFLRRISRFVCSLYGSWSMSNL
jgi:hypothetical protein